jgi:hypothetical protein
MTALWTSPGLCRAIARKRDSRVPRAIVVLQGAETDVAVARDKPDA